MTRPGIEVVHIGSACRDVAPDDPRGWRIGGGVMYAALTTARLGLRTAAVIGVDDLAAEAHELGTLRDAAVELLPVALAEGPIYHNVETPSGRVQTCVQPGVPLPLVTLPADWLSAPGWSVVPVAGEVRDDWAALIPAGAHVAVAWQGLLRDLHAGERVRQLAPGPSPILRRADLTGMSRHDVAPDIPLKALEDLLGPATDLLVTEGAAGGLLVRLWPDGRAELLRYRSSASDAEFDPTGAGDTFLAALQASGLRAATERAAIRAALDLRFAAAAGSLVVEGAGLAGVADLNSVLERLERDAAPDAVTSLPPEEFGRFWSEAPTTG